MTLLERSPVGYKPKTIAFLDQAETLGGAERFVLDFLRSLEKTDFRRSDFSIFGAQHPQYQELCPPEVTLIPFSFPSVRGEGLQKIKRVFELFACARKLRQEFAKKHIKEVFSNTPRTHFVMLLAKMILRDKRRWHVMIHDFTIPNTLLKLIGKYADTIIVNGIPTRNIVRESLSEKDFEKIRIIENSIDFTQIPKEQRPEKIEKILLLGRIDPRKGQMYALEAADLLLERNPELQFLIIGSPFSEDPRTIEYAHQLKSFAQERSLKNVSFYPEVASPFEVIEHCDCVLVLPTEPETFGRVVIEALSLGKLVLSFDEIGPKDILKSYEHFLGIPVQPLLVEKQNTMALAETIAFFADHPDHIKSYTESARLFVKTSFSAAETRKRLLHVFER